MLTAGYIGLGIMGKAMARNLLRAGFPLVVHNRSRAAVAELAAAGARPATSPAETAAHCDVLFTNLPDAPDVELVLFGPDGAQSTLRPGAIWVDNSTIAPTAARQFAARLAMQGVQALDAPVSGGDIGAREGTLAIMVGGPADALETVRPMLAAMGKTITHVGPAGTGQIAKCANQIMSGAQMAALAELLLLAQQAGADPRKVVAAIQGGAARCWALDQKPPRLFAGNRAPGFKARLHAKDLRIALETARACGVPLPTTAAVAELFEAMSGLGLGEQDNAAVIAVLEARCGARLQEPLK